MDSGPWKKVFVEWPEGIPRRGVLITSFGDQFPFGGFLTSDELLYFDRQTPDSIGARAMLLPYSNIVAVKFQDVVKPQALQAIGLQGMPSKR
jgi:hypothetical protein